MIPYVVRLAFVIFGMAVLSALPLQADAEKSPYSGDVQVKTLLRTSTNSVNQPIEYPHDKKAEVSVLKVEIAPGGETGWHQHPVPIFVYVLSGEVTVHFANGDKHTVHQGEAMAESVNMLHDGVNEGKEPAQLLIFVAGEKTVPFTIKEKTPVK